MIVLLKLDTLVDTSVNSSDSADVGSVTFKNRSVTLPPHMYDLCG